MDTDRPMSQEQQQIITTNILMAESELGKLVEAAMDHLRDTNMQCIRCCIGDSAGQALAVDADANVMMLVIAIRQLAEARLMAEQRAGQ